MQSLLRTLSRISIRIMAFNLLLVFLPVAGVLYLGSYESRLLASQRRALDAEARLLSAALAVTVDLDTNAPNLLQQRARLASRSAEPVRLRVIASDGRVVADSYDLDRPAALAPNKARRNILYRAGAALLRPILGLFRANAPDLPVAESNEGAERLLGAEVRTALAGQPASAERISADERSVTVYVAQPIRIGQEVIGAVLASQSTFTILQDLYTVRLGIVRIFVVSVIAAIILSLLVGTTIVGPIRQLRLEAGAMLDRRGRLRGGFKGSDKRDEIGELSRALERLTRRLDEHVRFIETFAADVSHEFKNPLASIRTATEMLAEVEEPAQRKRFRRMVEQDIARMESLLSGVREITIIDAQLPTETRQRVDVGALLQRIVEGFRLREKDRLEIRFSPAASPCVVHASEDRLIQVFVNVLENAVSFSPPNGIVSMSMECAERAVVVTISDQGPGIPEENLPRVFDRFFTHRPDVARSRASHTGLGLSIVKAIVEGYSGTVTASNNPEGGAKFEIRLPAN